MPANPLKSLVRQTSLYLCNHWVGGFPSHRLRRLYYRKVMGFRMGVGSSILLGCHFDAPRRFELGDHSVVNRGCRFGNRGGIVIGRNVSISPEVYISAGDHDPECPRFSSRHDTVTLGDHVYIGLRAMILKGVSIGEGAVVAAGAIVTRDVPPRAIVAGIPAKVIGTRTTPLDYQLDYLPWLE